MPVKLLQGESDVWIGIEFGIPAQSLRDALVIIIQDGRKRPEQMSRKDRSLRVRQIKSQFFDFGDRSHGGTIARGDPSASVQSRRTRYELRMRDRGRWMCPGVDFR